MNLLLGASTKFDNLGITIPENKLLKIRTMKNENVVTNFFGSEVPMIFDDDLPFKVKSSFESLGDPKSNTLMTVLSKATGGKIPSGQFALQNVQIWKSTDPMEMDFNVKIVMIDYAWSDVVSPCKKLMKLSLPKLANSGLSAKVGALIPPGPSVTQMLGLSQTSDAGGLGGLFGDPVTEGTLFKVIIGKFTINNVMITGADVTFSNEVDYYGYPISADVNISVRTEMVATKNMMDEIMGAY